MQGLSSALPALDGHDGPTQLERKSNADANAFSGLAGAAGEAGNDSATADASPSESAAIEATGPTSSDAAPGEDGGEGKREGG